MAKARTELVHCDNCGEDYAATYRRCPFCSGKASRQTDDYDDYDDYGDAPRRGGKRLAGGSPGGGGDPAKIAIYVLAALVLVAVICILLSIIIPKLVAPAPSASPLPSDTVSTAPSVEPSVEPTQTPSDDINTEDPSMSFHPLPVIDGAGDDPLDLDSPDLPPVEPDPVSSAGVTTPTPPATPKPSTPPASQVPSGALKLSSTDFTLSPRYPTYQLETGVDRALVTYSVKNEAVATISSTGLVTAVGDGNTTITVTDQNGATATAIVRVSGISGQSTQAPASQSPSSQAPSGNARLNLTDFSINAQYPDPVRLRVRDGQAAGWKSGNTSVATVSDNGTVTAVGNGHTKITCTLDDGSTLTCDVHVSGL